MLRNAAAVTAASYSRILGANETIHLGVIGCGLRGGGMMRTFQANPQVRVIALADVWGNKVDAFKRNAPDAAGFSDHRRLLESKDLDAVLIATPDHWHVPCALDAVNAGKDVYCEKPLTLHIGEARPLIQAVRANGRVFQTGMQQRSGAHYIQARDEYVKKGRLGKVTLIRTWWHGSVSSFVKPVPPELEHQPANLDWKRYVQPVRWRDYHPYQYNCFRAYLDFGGGQFTDLFTHWVDVAHMLMEEDRPVTAMAQGGFYIPEYRNDGSGRTAPDTVSAQLEYPGGWICTFEATMAAGVNSEGVELYGTKGRLFILRSGFEFTPVESGATPALPASPQAGSAGPGGRAQQPRQYRPPEFPPPPQTNQDTVIVKAEGRLERSHIDRFLECIKTRKQPPADVVTGDRAAAACHLCTLSYKEKRQIRFDPDREEVVA
jgi:predicted dehydrogenase